MTNDAPVQVVEYTDPFCSWAWGTEPVRRYLRWRHGERIAWRLVMGGLVPEPDPERPPADDAVAADRARRAWAEVSAHTGAPWPARLTRPVRSSLPACRAVKAAENQGVEVAERVLRRLREALFVLGDPPDDANRIVDAVAGVAGLDAGRLRADLDAPVVSQALARDMAETRDPLPVVIDLDDPGPGSGRAKPEGDGWRYVFPTFVVRGEAGTEVVAGWKPLDAYLGALEAVSPGVTADARPLPDPAAALHHWRSLTEPELALLCAPEGAPPVGAQCVDLGGGALWCAPGEAEVRGLA